MRLPPWRVCVALVLAFLGFGVIVGSAASSRPSTLVAAQGPLRIMLPAASAPTATTPAVTDPAAAPTVTPTPTPAPSPTTTTTTPTPTPTSTGSSTTPAPSSGGAGSGSSGTGSSKGGSQSATASKLPPIKHVFVIVLADQPYAAVFGPASQAHYLAGTLEKRGELLVRYYAVAHEELANQIAMISGQGPNAATAADCQVYAALTPATAGADGQTTGDGCLYPTTTATIASQLQAKHLAWRAYVEGMAAGTPPAPASCAHPAIGATDPSAGLDTPTSSGGGSYATFRNPFVYFHAVIDSPSCAADDVGLDKLSADLASPGRTPALSYIVPSLCDDGRPTACASGQPAGLPAADGFLRKVVPKILASKAYKDDGLLAITVDQAPSSGVDADSSSCCGQPRYPGLPPGAAGLPPSGGGEVGALLLSRFVKPNTLNQDQYNHFSLLRTIEDLFALKHLGYAASRGVSSFDSAVFSDYHAG